ncbi:uncharacterized protein JN550_006656 [Neoarthrinium moseri]|uniref:uncharacterized protein n=1 Tax=Neoarthrinium moseri TaxID=1658444 RepID=UPI001FDCB8BE|nr:uncharacterized protein JN550_006656 [Neoarthrinium moseri]KAI1867849.1 hypothetical protein JN550_006656 [Neoarthrinium moseri]
MSGINPIIPGFAPDPSVVRVGEWFFLVNSTFHMFPGLPIYASQDLVNWKHIGNALHRQSQMSLKKSDTKLYPQEDTGEVLLATGGLYAPTIRYHRGIYYVICTNIVHPAEGAPDVSENFVLSTKDIWANSWSDPVYFEFQGIDPSLLFDDDGKVYVHGSAAPGPFTKINLFEVDLATGKKLSDERTIWGGTGGIYPEGPHMYKRNGWYYLLISEGGTHDNHMITMARSQDIWGPYEPCPQNPILTARGTGEYIQYTGHCEAFQDQDGNWWGACLGVRKDAKGRFIMGRETFLTSGNWNGDWLSLDLVKSNIETLSSREKLSDLPQIDKPGLDILYIRDADFRRYRFDGHKNGDVTLIAAKTDLSAPEESPTFMGKRQRRLCGQSLVDITLSDIAVSADVNVGLACYKDEHRYLRIFYDGSDSTVVFEVVNNAKKISQTKRTAITLSQNTGLSFKLQYTEDQYEALFRVGGKSGNPEWSLLETVDTLVLTGPDFVGPVIGVFAVAETDAEVHCTSLVFDEPLAQKPH